MTATIDAHPGTSRVTGRVAVVGAGGIGRAHAEAVAGLPGATLAAVSDVHAAAAESVAGLHGGEVLSVAALADPDRIDLVVVASPPATHPEVVGPLLRAGVPVMCEKPLAIDAATARALADLSVETGTPLTMATKFRFVDDVRRTREMIADGTLGEIVKIEVSFAGRVDMTARWNGDPAVSGGGVLIDNATHGVDLVRFLVGDITGVLAVAGPRVQDLAVEDSATLLATTARGAIAQVDVSWSTRRLAPVFCAVYGSEGSVEIGWAGSLYATGGAGPVAFGTGYGKIDSLRQNLAAVLAALAAGAPMPVTSDDAAATAAVVDAAYAGIGAPGFLPVTVSA